MSAPPKDPAAPDRHDATADEARRRRLAEALRENLRRRKAQTRGRREQATDAAAPGPQRPADDGAA